LVDRAGCADFSNVDDFNGRKEMLTVRPFVSAPAALPFKRFETEMDYQYNDRPTMRPDNPNIHGCFPMLWIRRSVYLGACFACLACASTGWGQSSPTVSSRRVEFGQVKVAKAPKVSAGTSTHVAVKPVTIQATERRTATGKSVASPQSSRPRSLVARAAHGEIMTEPLPEMLYQEQFGMHGEPGCGIEGCTSCCDSHPEVLCGVEPVCGIEPGCGLEGCGHCGPMMMGPVGCDSGMFAGPIGCDSAGLGPCGGFFDECYPLLLPVKRLNWSNFEFFAGTQAFSGPANFAGANGAVAANRDGTASFGIHEGFNFARQSFLLGGGISSQFGLRAVQSNASGAEFTSSGRSQIFLTGGFFRRVDYGLQGGVVVDYMNDDWYYNVDLTQIRAHLGWKMDPCNEFGYQYFGSIGDDTSIGSIDLGTGLQQINVNLESTDQHRIFFRRTFRRGGSGELFAGTTDESDGILGAALDIPLVDALSMRTGVTYLNPNLGPNQRDNQEESWNLAWTFVWYPCGSRARSPYDRPMFDVADNGTFMVDSIR
jgi:hypothetical protein